MSIPFLLTPNERDRCKTIVKNQPGNSHTQQIQLVSRIWSVLKWWHRENGNGKDGDGADETMAEFTKSLSRVGVDLVISPPKVVAETRKK